MSYIVNSQVFEVARDAAFEHVSTYLQSADDEFLTKSAEEIVEEMERDGWVCNYLSDDWDEEGFRIERTLDPETVLEAIRWYLDG